MRLHFPSPADLLHLFNTNRTPSLTHSDSADTSPNNSDGSITFPTPSIVQPQVSPNNGKSTWNAHASIVTNHGPTSSWPVSPGSANLLDVLKYPPILAFVLDYIAWRNFLAFAQTCREAMGLIHVAELKDVILSRFIPSYKYALRERNLSRFKDVHVTLHDISLFLISHHLPLKNYPKHARIVLLAPDAHENKEQARISERFVDFALAHSRIVLLLQSLVHSSNVPIQPEPVESRWRSRLSQPCIRELTFPSPLAYSSSPIPKPDHDITLSTRTPTKLIHRRASSTGNATIPQRRSSPMPSPALTKGVRRVSLFGSTAPVPPPPPASVPRAMKVYSGTWRRASQSISDDDFIRSLPHRRFTFSRVSSDSSLNVRSPVSPGAGPGRNGPFSPHDLQMAISRNRAPVLRAFVPCFELSEEVIAECEEQLADAELLEHLSIGDLVCNLGYVLRPPPSEGDPFLDYLTEVGERRQQLLNEVQTWLVWNGYTLVPFTPPDPPPLEDPLSLPSPCYYAHVLPLYTNPRFRFCVPACYTVPQLDLAYTSTRTASPHSLTGYVMVNKSVWMARVRRYRQEGTLSTGWMGEWVLEGAGTKEGYEDLLRCLRGDATKQEWELVKEKSGGGRVWLKLIHSHRLPGSVHASVLCLRTV